ncbi:MAG: ribonuclease HII [Patescibacteria group bacterium]
MTQRTIPTLVEEEKMWRNGQYIIGVDEAGRGPLAGPVMAAACMLQSSPKSKVESPKSWNSAPRNDFEDLLALGVNDSKKLSPKKRDKIYEALTSHPLVLWSVGEASEKEIDEINILQASLLAMRRAVEKLIDKNDWLEQENFSVYIDGREVIPNLTANQKSIINGDAKVFSIAAASIIAKVTRDRLILKYAEKYPQYGFEKHKGYGTKLHYEMLKKHGACPIHRRAFIKSISI